MSQIQTKFIANGAVVLTTKVSGILPVANGGTNSSTALVNNRIMSTVGGAIVEAAAITAARALISDANGIPTHSTVTSTELGYVSGVTSAIQTQLNAKANTALSNLASTAINVSLLPDTDGTLDIGSTSLRFNAVYTVSVNDAAGIPALDVGLHSLMDTSSTQSVDGANRTLVDVNATPALDFSSGTVIKITPTDASAPRSLEFRNGADTFGVSIKAPTLSASYTLTLPVDDGTASQVLTTNGTGVLSWTTPSGSSTNGRETFVLSGTDITNQFITLAHTPLANSVNFAVQGAGSLLEGASYDYSITGAQINFLNDLATGGGAALTAGNVVQVTYEY